MHHAGCATGDKEMTPRVKVDNCFICGEHASCAPDIEHRSVCRVCDPDNWKIACELDKQMWINGAFDELLEASK